MKMKDIHTDFKNSLNFTNIQYSFKYSLIYNTVAVFTKKRETQISEVSKILTRQKVIF